MLPHQVLGPDAGDEQGTYDQGTSPMTTSTDKLTTEAAKLRATDRAAELCRQLHQRQYEFTPCADCKDAVAILDKIDHPPDPPPVTHRATLHDIQLELMRAIAKQMDKARAHLAAAHIGVYAAERALAAVLQHDRCAIGTLAGEVAELGRALLVLEGRIARAMPHATLVTPGHPTREGAGYDCTCGECEAARSA